MRATTFSTAPLLLLALWFGGSSAAPSGPPSYGYQPPQPTYHAPHPTYHPPQPTYHAPQPTYHAPQPTYQPTPAYHAPQPTYQPAPTYHAPQPTYHAPQPTYDDHSVESYSGEQQYHGNNAGYSTTTYTEVDHDDSGSYEHKQPTYAPPAPTYGSYHQAAPYHQPKETYHPAKKVKVDTNIAYYAPIYKKSGYGYHAKLHKVGEAAVHQYQSQTSTHGGGYKVEKPGYGGYNKVEEHYVDSKPEYKFGYDINGGYLKINAHEARDGYVTRGSYSFKQPDGLTRIVDYYVDKWGFHPTVRYVKHH